MFGQVTTRARRLAVDQLTWGAERNRTLADQADPASDEMLLPLLDDGVTLLDVDGGRGILILQFIVLNHLLLHDGPAFWVDANWHATTTNSRGSHRTSDYSTGSTLLGASPPTSITAPSVVSSRR